MIAMRWNIVPGCEKDHDEPDPGDIWVGMRHEAGCELRRWHIHGDGETMIGVNTGPGPCVDCGAKPGEGHYEKWNPPPADPDKDQDFEDLARILNKLSDRGLITGINPAPAYTHAFQPKEDDVSPPYTFTRAEIGEELPARKLYDENEARAIEHIATARGMLLGELLNEAENEFNRRVVDLLTSALMELVPHE